jgi:hypothetical protein
MPDPGFKCPFCQGQIASEVIILWRPFGCPHCHQLIVLRRRYGWFQGVGCLTIFAACSAGLILALHLHWVLSMIAALISGVALSTLARNFLLRRWPGPPNFRPYIVRDHPEVLNSVLALVESVAEVEAWTVNLNSHLEIVRSQISLDDELENSALELIAYLRSTLQGLPFRRAKGLPSNLSPEGVRRELRSISVDLRLAAGE